MGKTKKVLQMQIKGIKLVKFELVPQESIGITEDIDKIEYFFENQLTINILSKPDFLNVILEVRIRPFIDKKQFGKVVEIAVQSSYEIKNLDSYLDEDQKLKLPDSLFEKLILSSISNTRGFMAAQLANTDYKDIILPLTSVDDLEF